MARRYMGEMSPEEFRRRVQGDFEDAKSQYRAQQQYKAEQESQQQELKQKRKKRKETYETSSEYPYWENPLDRLMWKSVYNTATATFVPDYIHNRLKVIVKDYHQQEYSLDNIIREYMQSCKRKGHSWQDITRSEVATGKNFIPLFEWLIETGQFPYPYEVAVGVRHHYIDMKQLL